jgi:hypothetical protein
MDERQLKTLAYEIAEATPEHLDKPTMPPIGWREDPAGIKVILADGRCIYAPIPETAPKPKGKSKTSGSIDTSDGVDDDEASLAGKALQAKKDKTK